MLSRKMPRNNLQPMKLFICCLCLVASLKMVSSITKPLSLPNKEEESANWEDELSSENSVDNSQIDYFANDYHTKSFAQSIETDQLELSRILEKLLEQTGNWKAPVFILEVPSQQIGNTPEIMGIDNNHDVKKKSRYYRRYPWKRRNSSNYDYREEQYLCMPSRKEVVKLLVALHGARARKGLVKKDVDFCKRQKSGGSILTNIRFLGRRK